MQYLDENSVADSYDASIKSNIEKDLMVNRNDTF